MPGMQRLVDKLASENFALLTVNISDPPARIREFMKRLDLGLPVLLDPNGATFKIWEGKILPTSFLVDPAGKVRYRVTGPMEWDDPEVITLLRHLAGSR
jgi:peroxiredoxin